MGSCGTSNKYIFIIMFNVLYIIWLCNQAKMEVKPVPATPSTAALYPECALENHGFV